MEKPEEENRKAGEKEERATTYPKMAGEAAEYQQLVENAELFLHKLRDFHSSFRTHFISPCIGGTTLDLHRLFVEVTARGGLNQVITERKWEEVVSAFTTGIPSFKRSFLLRKYYLSLLYHFEQAYFLKKNAPSVAITDAAKKISVSGLDKESTSNCNEESTTLSHLQASIRIRPGSSLVGVIDEKLDNGYVVSVNVGSDILKGILYHIPDKPHPSWSPNHGIPRRRKRKKSQQSLVEYTTLNPISQGQENSYSNNGHILSPLSQPEKQPLENNGVTAMESDRTEAVNSVINS